MARTAALPKTAEVNDFEPLVSLFGGTGALKHNVSTPIEAHELIKDGIPSGALENLVTNLQVMEASDAFEFALGISQRTFQRHKASGGKTLSTEQSSRTWNFASVLTKAASVLGSQSEAEAWLVRPATGLENHRPIDLLSTPAGTQLVQDFLDRLDYGVYA